MRGCLTSVRFNMVCDILKPAGAPEINSDQWEWRQDPDSGSIVKVWLDNPDTPDIDESRSGEVVSNVPLLARGVLTSGIQGAGSMEKYGDIYTNVDWIKATFPKSVVITKRDRVTNIRTKSNQEVVWKEEEISGYPPTVFEVMGVTPVFDPFSKLLEYSVLMQRSEVQGGR